MADNLTEPDAQEPVSDEVDKRMEALENAEQAVEAAFGSGKADRAAITKAAQDDAHEVVRKVGEAMVADEKADEAGRLAIITANMGDREKTKAARARARQARRDAKRAHRSATKTAKAAYETIKFSQPGKLGFMRIVQVVYALNIAYTLFMLLLTSRDTIIYNSVTIVDWITIILQGVGFWFFVNYFKVTKKFVIFTAVFSIVMNIVEAVLGGGFSLFELSIANLWHLFLILYFTLSKRVDTVLVNDFSSYRPKRQAQPEIKRSGWPFVRNLIIYFIVFSVLGHWMEAGMCQFIRLGLVQGKYDPSNTMLWRDWLYPYPMEGAAVVIIALVLYPLWRYLLKRFDKPIYAYIVSFIANALTCSAIEFVMGLVVNSNYQLWDYRENFGNIMGQVCLQNALAFGVAASVIAWFVYPALERWLARIPNDTMNIVFVVIAVIGGILWSLYIIDPPANHVLTAEESQKVQVTDARREYDDSIYATEVNISRMEELAKRGNGLSQEDRDKIAQQVEEMKKNLQTIKDTVQYEK